MTYQRTCKLCGTAFETTKPHSNVCNECKNKPCEVCGKSFVHEWPYNQRACSPECRHLLRIDLKNVSQKEAKKRQHLMEKYGVDNVSKLPEIKEKLSERTKSEEVKNKMRKTSMERYGAVWYQCSDEGKERIRQRFIEKYGVDNPAKSDVIKQKISERLKDPEVRQKYIESCLEHYGVSHSNLVDEIKSKREQTCMEKYGVPYYVMSPEYRSAQATHQISLANQAFADILKNDYGINTEFEFKVGNKFFDIHILDSNILIEINPTYTHSDLPNHWCDGLNKDYHINKTLTAEKAGYRCIHMFDWDNTTKIAEMLCSKTVIYARNCTLTKVNPNQISEFIAKNHLQGNAKGAKYAYALIYKGQLVSAMTFGKPRYTKNYQWELLRLCTDSKYTVIGGASKMFKHFIEEADPDSILSYCDKSKFTGNVYAKLGMTLSHISQPAKIWSKGTEYITDNLLRQRGYDQLFNTNYGKGTSNEQLMIENGWRSVYDCGQYVFEWHKEKE